MFAQVEDPPPPKLQPARGQPVVWVVYFGFSGGWPEHDTQVEWDIPFKIAKLPPSASILGIW